MRPTGCPRPTADELRARHAAIHHLQRGDKLLCEEVAPPPLISERRQRAWEIEAAHHPTIARLMAPDRDHDRLGNADLLLDPLQARPLGLIGVATIGDQRRGKVLRLIRREIGNPGIGIGPRLRPIQIDHALVERQRRHHRIQRRPADAARSGLCAERL
ncbi:hypothetical protein D9M73_107080 [compost metagenome]